jgi:hypothetical protein
MSWGRLFMRTTRSPKLLTFSTAGDAVNNMAALFSGMARLTDLTLKCQLESDSSGASLFTRLQQISLNVEAMIAALSQAKVERLKKLSIFTHPIPHRAKELAHTLANFVNRQQATLNSLTISDGYSLLFLPHPASFLLAQLGYFPFFQKLTLEVPLGEIGAPAVWKVADAHKNTLTDLTITDYHPDSLDGIRLPALEYLDLRINPTIGDPYTPAILALLRCTTGSLVILKLPIQNLYSYEDACAILEALAPCSQLRILALTLDYLSPQILDRFAKHVPSLLKLTLRIIGYTDMSLNEGTAEEKVGQPHLPRLSYMSLNSMPRSSAEESHAGTTIIGADHFAFALRSSGMRGLVIHARVH